MFEKTPQPDNSTKETPSLPYEEFKKLPDTERSELVTHTYQHLQELLSINGYKKFVNVSEMYQELDSNNYIVRREDPKNIEQLLAVGESFEITHNSDTEYANCVEWNPSSQERSLENAYLEGYGAKNGVVVVEGIRPSEHTKVKSLPESTPDFYGLDRRGVRSVTGTVNPEQITFISIRIPAQYLPESELSEDELDTLFEWKNSKNKNNIPFVHRGFLRKTQ